MKTSSLIDLLSQDALNLRPYFRLHFSRALALSIGLLCAFFIAFFNFRRDISDAFITNSFLVKLGFTLALTAILGFQTYKSVSPTHKIDLKWFFAPLCLLVLAFLFESDKAQTLSTLSQTSWAACLFFIPILSILSLIPLLLVLKKGASQNPSLSGLTLGGFCGAFGANFYAFHCTEDSSLFVFIFYTSAILIAALFGMILGRKLLQW